MIIIGWIAAVVIGIFLLTVFRGAPYVPSHRRDVDEVFRTLYKLKKSDVLVDIGSGDGKVCLLAAEHGARAVGYEINPILVLVARWRARNQKLVTFRWRDFWVSQLPDDTTVVYTFGDGRDIARMANYVEKQATRMGRPLHFISYAFEVPDREQQKAGGSAHVYKIMPLQSPQA